MIVNELLPQKSHLPLVQQMGGIENTKPLDQVTFKDTLNEFVGDVNNLQQESSEQVANFIKGEPVDLHDVMITVQKAKTSFQLLLEIRNKAMDLYREVNRIQV
jgi:flagellar hook-basal body complex protein FliE